MKENIKKIIVIIFLILILLFYVKINSKNNNLRTSEDVLQEIEASKIMEESSISNENAEPKKVSVSFVDVKKPKGYDKSEMEETLRNTVITDWWTFFQTDYDSFKKPRDRDTFSISINGLEYEGIVKNFDYDDLGEGKKYYSFDVDIPGNTTKIDMSFSLLDDLFMEGEIIDYSNKVTNGYMIRYANGIGLYMGTKEYNKKMFKIISFD